MRRIVGSGRVLLKNRGLAIGLFSLRRSFGPLAEAVGVKRAGGNRTELDLLRRPTNAIKALLTYSLDGG